MYIYEFENFEETEKIHDWEYRLSAAGWGMSDC
jgi:hypothetical protein